MKFTDKKEAAANYLARADVIESGFNPTVPCAGAAVHDFTVEGLRFQVKRADVLDTNTKGEITLDSYSRKDIDVFAIVNLENRRVAYVHVSEIVFGGDLTISLQRERTRTGLPSPKYFEEFEGIKRVFSLVKETGARP